MKSRLPIVILVGIAGATVLAGPQTFDFKDPKGVNNARFSLDAPLEAISGNATGVSGTVTFDPVAPGAAKGRIVVASSSLRLPNSMMQQHLQSDKWLDVAKYPEISFEATALQNIKTEGGNTAADVTGRFTLKGVSKELTLPVKFTYLKGKLGQRVPRMEGDLLVIRANFSIKRSDFGVNAGQFEDKVSDTIELTLSIAGAAPK